MKNKILLSVLGLFLVSGASTAFAGFAECAARQALMGKDIVLKPGETQTFIYDFRDPGCLDTRYESISPYLADANVPISGCLNTTGQKPKIEMVLTDLTNGIVATQISASSLMLKEPNSTKYYGYIVTGHLLEMKITLASGVRKCMNTNLRFAFSEGPF